MCRHCGNKSLSLNIYFFANSLEIPVFPSALALPAAIMAGKMYLIFVIVQNHLDMNCHKRPFSGLDKLCSRGFFCFFFLAFFACVCVCVCKSSIEQKTQRQRSAQTGKFKFNLICQVKTELTFSKDHQKDSSPWFPFDVTIVYEFSFWQYLSESECYLTFCLTSKVKRLVYHKRHFHFQSNSNMLLLPVLQA